MLKIGSFLISASLAAGILAVAGAADANAAPSGFCARYADTAISQQRTNQARRCGYSGLRWHRAWDVHYGWCLTKSRAAANAETAARARQLRSCARRGGGGGVFTRRFNAPRIGGVRLDWCKYWARDCGKPAADAFCRSRGYRRAVDFAQARDIGRWTGTKVIATGQICSGDFCDGFRYIICRR